MAELDRVSWNIYTPDANANQRFDFKSIGKEYTAVKLVIIESLNADEVIIHLVMEDEKELRSIIPSLIFYRSNAKEMRNFILRGLHANHYVMTLEEDVSAGEKSIRE